MGDVTGEMIDAAAPRRIPAAALGLAALLLAGVLVGGLLLVLGGGGGGHKPAARLASSKTVDGEVNLTALTAEQLQAALRRASTRAASAFIRSS